MRAIAIASNYWLMATNAPPGRPMVNASLMAQAVEDAFVEYGGLTGEDEDKFRGACSPDNSRKQSEKAEDHYKRITNKYEETH